MKGEKRGHRKRLAGEALDVEEEALKLLPEWRRRLWLLMKEVLRESEEKKEAA